MAQRLLKIILPPGEKKHALQILESSENTMYWMEEDSEESFIVSALTEAENSEKIMDGFERNYSSTDGFKLIVFPVEASIPRTDSQPERHQKRSQKKNSTMRISREELYADIVDSTKLSATYVLMVILSTIVVSVGLLQNNVAVIIGAMVIAPFLGPNVALALSSCLADKDLGRNALKTLASGVLMVIGLTLVLGFAFNTNPEIPEVQSRTMVGVQDVILALASGCAGVLAFTTGISSAVIGVMVAVALLPPLTVFGLLLGAGYPMVALGALVLFCTNIICINLAGVTTFYFQGVTPRSWWEAGKARRAAKIAIFWWSTLILLLILVIYFTNIKNGF